MAYPVAGVLIQLQVEVLTCGRFSNVFEQPAYQKKFVEQYFTVAKNLPDSSYYNATGRAYVTHALIQ